MPRQEIHCQWEIRGTQGLEEYQRKIRMSEVWETVGSFEKLPESYEHPMLQQEAF
jgi:hypothetical protein